MGLKRLIGNILLASTILCWSAGAALAVSVTTDLPEYGPGDTVFIVGTGFQPADSIIVAVTRADTLAADPWNLEASLEGSVQTFWVVPVDSDLVDTLWIELDGETSGFTDCFILTSNVSLELINVPDTLCAGDTVTVCANLAQKCNHGSYAPLEDRLVLFFINPGNCGANVGQNADDSVFTDASGNACATLIVPSTPGTYTIRAKFRGEDKPSPCPTPGNSACNPYSSYSSK